jgi:serine/threonine protein kinase
VRDGKISGRYDSRFAQQQSDRIPRAQRKGGMADLPNLNPGQVAQLVSSASQIKEIGSGGQKRVFQAVIENKPYAIKVAKVGAVVDDGNDLATTEIGIRARREVETMRDCTSPHMVKLGPIGLTFRECQGQQLLFFSEEYVEGRDLNAILTTDGPFPWKEVAKLGIQITLAIKSLWELSKIHRDIKPANIMKRATGGDYVLLDAGFAFDLGGESLSIGPVGTPAFFSPEQFDHSNRRASLDFRSDIFSLGVTMYCVLTASHPFVTPGVTPTTLYTRITGHDPQPPSAIVAGVPPQLDEIILRMLRKSPHLRFRRCDQLIEALRGL